jgi:hypothetical protein
MTGKIMNPYEEARIWKNTLKDMRDLEECSLNKPVLMVIPDEGIIISCPCHLEGHFIRPSVVISC